VDAEAAICWPISLLILLAAGLQTRSTWTPTGHTHTQQNTRTQTIHVSNNQRTVFTHYLPEFHETNA